MSARPALSLVGLALSGVLSLSLSACKTKAGDDSGTSGDGGGMDGGGADGGGTDGGGTDGGGTDGGGTDGGGTDGGGTDGGGTDGGGSDGGADTGTDGGGTDGGSIDTGGDTGGGAVELNCVDGIDNDADGTIDCADSDCERAPACYESMCADGRDNDRDGLTDCDDPDCEADPSCVPGTCPSGDLGSVTGDAVSSGASGTSSTFEGDCGRTGGGDLSFTWSAPADGCYAIDTLDSDYDTVLRLFASCDSDELSCNDDYSDLTSQLSFSASTGDGYVIVVDAYSRKDSGTYSLDINATTITASIDGDLGSSTGNGVATGTMAGTEDHTLDASCGDATGLDYLYTWTAPEDAIYVFDTEDSTFDTVLSLHEDGGCYTDLYCDDDSGAVSLTSKFRYAVTAGTTYVIRVAGYSSSATGTFSLDINMATGGGDTGSDTGSGTGTVDTGVVGSGGGRG